jgi:hypothetical protein
MQATKKEGATPLAIKCKCFQKRERAKIEAETIVGITNRHEE